MTRAAESKKLVMPVLDTGIHALAVQRHKRSFPAGD